MKRTPAPLAALPFLSASLLLLATAATASDAVPERHNGAEPRDGRETVNLRELWRAGGEDDEVFFGVIGDAATDSAGDVYLLDQQLAEVQVYTGDGEFLRTLGHEGDGPGEFRRPSGLMMLPGGRVGVVTGFPGKIVVLEADGTPGPSIDPGDAADGGFNALFGAREHDGGLVLCGARMTRLDEGMSETRYLSLCDMKGAERVRLLDVTHPRDFGHPKYVEADEYFVQHRWAVGRDGRIYTAPERDRYAVHVFGPDGVPAFVFTRDYTPRKRTQAEKDEVGSDMRIVINGKALEFERQVLDDDPCIEGMFVDADGLLWVENGHSRRVDGVFRRYDVFSPDGDYLRQVDLVCPGDPEQDGLFPLGDGRFMVIKGLEAARAAAEAGFEDQSDNEEDTGDAAPLEVIAYSR